MQALTCASQSGRSASRKVSVTQRSRGEKFAATSISSFSFWYFAFMSFCAAELSFFFAARTLGASPPRALG